MNLNEGIRRTSLVFGGLLALCVFVGFAVTAPKTPDIAAWSAKVDRALQADFDPTGKFSIVWDSPPLGTSFIKDSCQNPQRMLLKEVCAEYAAAEKGIIWEQAEHMAYGFFGACGALFLCLLAGRLLAWVLAGFMRPSETNPK